MPGIFASVRINNPLGLIIFLVVWILACEFAHVLVMLWRHERPLGWAVGPFGITIMYLHEPSLFYIWLNVLCPAFVSGTVLYFGLFTSLSPVTLPHHPLVEFFCIFCGLVLSSTMDVIQAIRDVFYPLWGDARVLRNIQLLRAGWAKIHFTSFGQSYVLTHFRSNPTELLRAF